MRVANTLVLLLAVLAASAGCNRSKSETAKESSVVVFRGADGRALTMDQLRGLTGTFQYQILGKSDVPAEAESLHVCTRAVTGAVNAPANAASMFAGERSQPSATCRQ